MGAQEDKTSGLHDWWVETSDKDLEGIAQKADEYGSFDLQVQGETLARWLDVPRTLGQEMACMAYILGKVARALSAYQRGQSPSVDTLKDIVAYAMMARRIREVGKWP